MKTLAKALSIKEASQIVRSMKTPNDFAQRIELIKNYTTPAQNEYTTLGKLITELLATFPNSLPQFVLLEKAIDLDLNEEFVLKTITQLNQDGFVLINKGFQNKLILKFPNIPFSAFGGKIQVSQPLTSVQFRKKIKNSTLNSTFKSTHK